MILLEKERDEMQAKKEEMGTYRQNWDSAGKAMLAKWPGKK